MGIAVFAVVRISDAQAARTPGTTAIGRIREIETARHARNKAMTLSYSPSLPTFCGVSGGIACLRYGGFSEKVCEAPLRYFSIRTGQEALRNTA